MFVENFFDAAQQLFGSLAAKQLCEKWKLAQVQGRYASAAFFQGRNQPLGEADHVFSAGERITISQLQKLLVGTVQKAIAVDHEKDQQQSYRRQHCLDDRHGALHIGSLPASGTYAEQVPVVYANRFKQERIFVSFIAEG